MAEPAPGAPGATPARPRRRRRSATQTVTLTDVARLAGVSSQTVSRTLRTPTEVSDETRARVESAVRESGYVPNLTARGLASNSSKLVATIIPSISTSIFAETLDAATEVLSTSGYELVLGINGYDTVREEQLVRNLLGRRPDGVLLVGVRHTEATVAMLQASGLPVVETWEWTSSPIDALVGFSNRDAMADLTRALVERGYRRPVFVGSQREGDDRSRQRFEGFAEQHRRSFGDAEPRFVDASALPLTLGSGARLLAEARSAHPDADLLVFATDILAAGALLAAEREGLRVPDDVAISGFGDFELAAAVTPALTTVSVPAARLGEIAASHLLERIATAEASPAQVDVGYEVVLRASA
ncbi:LacI family DNA-binding transcriptional regulator [Mumia sp. DW29H23]|uniref:LacI family DNA-binding transcriptional regulator n=1 Tax=Mumia sp. DW29H23 TaxID=3421241 RepID=UPI003D69A8BA